MLSICIPVFNFDVTNLLTSLHKEIIKLSAPIEIICIDDCSSNCYREKNQLECNQYGTYIQLTNNVGRAKIRNLFTEHAKYEYLLFLDCDTAIVTDNFIEQYLENLGDGNNLVMCGGIIYDKTKPERQNLLRWRYGQKIESQSFTVRKLNPYRSFMTGNFLIHRSVLNRVCFNEKLVNYGHEDTLFGFSLKKEHFPILHINNPVLHDHLESNGEFLSKTELGLKNLIQILHYVNNDPQYIEDVKILRYYQKYRKNHIILPVEVTFLIFKSLIKFLLLKGVVNLFLFNFYKLGFFAIKYRETK